MFNPPLFLSGRAIQGFKQGRLLGLPTANIDIHHAPDLIQGVYMGYTRVIPEMVNYPSIIFWGKPHALPAVAQPRLEVHLLKQELDLYDTILEVTLLSFLRQNREFPNKEILENAIQQDLEYALKYFNL